MRFKFNKEIEYLFKKFLVSEKYLLKKRLIRAYKKRYEEELLFLDKIVDKNSESVDVGVYRGVYTFQLAKISKHVHSFEPNPLIFPYLNKNNIVVFMGAGSVTSWAKNFVKKYR